MKNKALYVSIGVIVALGGLVAGASAYTGRAVTSRMSQQTAELDKLLPGLRVEEKISRGLFSSTRDLKIQVGCMPLPAADGKSLDKTTPIEARWRDTIHHVPFLRGQRSVATIDSELAVSSKEVEQVFGNRAPLTVHTQIDLDGGFDSDAKLASFKFAPKPGDELEFSGLTLRMKGKIPEGAGTFAYTGSTEPITLNAKGSDGTFTVALGKTDLTGSMLFDSTALSLLRPYEQEARISEMTARVEAPARDGAAPMNYSFSAQGVSGKAESKIANDLWSYTSRVQGRIEAEGFVIDKFEMASAIRNLHVPTADKLQQAFMSHAFSCDPAQSSDNPLAEFEALADTAFELLPHNPEYQMGPIAIELGGKRAELSYTLGVRGVAAGTPPPPMMELAMKHGYASAEAKLHLGLIDQLAAWGQKLAATAAGPHQQRQAAAKDGPDASAMMARAMLDGFVQQGFLERDGETVRGRVEVETGAFKLNGRPFELPDFGLDMDAMKSLMEAGGPLGDVGEPADKPTQDL